MERRFIIAVLAVGVAGVALASLSVKRKPVLSGIAVGDFGKVPDFSLTDQEGAPFGRDRLKGPWIAAFIFTRCSGQCPMMTGRMKGLSAKLPNVRFVSFSVDPADSPKVLKSYAEGYGARWTFLTGRPGEVRALSEKGFKLGAADGGPPEEPILHSQRLVLVDGDGTIRGYFDLGDELAEAALLTAAASL